MRKAGMIVAVEMDAIKKKYGNPKKTFTSNGYTVFLYLIGNYELFILPSGAGEIAAASSTQFLISEYDVEIIFNFGIVGGLTDSISSHRICVVKDVVHYDFDTSEADNSEQGRYLNYSSVYIPVTQELVKKAVAVIPELVEVTCASGDKFIGSPERKMELNKKFGAVICEMEAAGIVLTCNRNNIPCLLIKMVADGLNGGSEEFYKEFIRCSDTCLSLIDRIICS